MHSRKVGRNDPCQCGSGIKFKHCCGANGRAAPSANAAQIVQAIAVALEYQRSGRLQEAEAIYQNILAIDPNHPDALHLLGTLAHQVGKHQIAVELIEKAVKIKPSAGMHYNLGLAFHGLSDLDRALASYKAAVELEPGWADAHNNIGVALLDMGHPDQAARSHRRASELRPDNAEAFSNYLLAAQYDPDYRIESLLSDHRAYAQRFEEPLRAHWPSHAPAGDAGRRLRVGFLSGDFRNHPVGFFIEGVLTRLSGRSLDIYLYSTHPAGDGLTDRLRRLKVEWRPIFGLTDAEASAVIRDDGIDILVDLAGHTAHNRLLTVARKPAPVQISWLGYVSTTGLAAVDYFLCDQYTVPESEAHHFTETPWRLPQTRLCFTPPVESVEVGPLPVMRDEPFTFGCFNNLAKINDSVIRLWAQVLLRMPESRLFLKSRQYDSAAGRADILQRFAQAGIAGDRLLIEGFSSRLDYLVAYRRVDLALDPFPFPGGATSVEGLWMGVPIVTMRGDRFIARQGSSMLRVLGLDDWIASDAADYLRIALEKAARQTELSTLRQTLRDRLLSSALCDAEAFAGALESAFLSIWASRSPGAAL